MNTAHTLSIVKYFLIVTGTVIIIDGFVKDGDLVTFLGAAILIAAFFLKQIANELKR